MITGYAAVFIFMLAAFTGYEVIGRVPVILHTPLMSGSNFVHGIVVVGAMVALGEANTTPQRIIGFVAVLLGTANAVGGYAVTERMLEMFKPSTPAAPPGKADGAAPGEADGAAPDKADGDA
jgi:H+-translocating NAD(P) transhydrogenase subunit alpha